MITCPADIIGPSTIATWTNGPIVSDNLDENPGVSCTHASGDSFDPGVTTVSCTATDHASNTNTCEFNVIFGKDQSFCFSPRRVLLKLSSKYEFNSR